MQREWMNHFVLWFVLATVVSGVGYFVATTVSPLVGGAVAGIGTSALLFREIARMIENPEISQGEQSPFDAEAVTSDST